MSGTPPRAGRRRALRLLRVAVAPLVVGAVVAYLAIGSFGTFLGILAATCVSGLTWAMLQSPEEMNPGDRYGWNDGGGIG